VDKKRVIRRYWGIFTTIIVAIILVFAVMLVGFRLFGYEIYTVMSGSMEPEYHVGSLIYVKSVDVATLKEGDVITFVADENNTVITHRINGIVYEGDELKFRTKGDANNVADGKLVHYKNVLGSPAFQIPLIGYLAFFIQRPPGIYIALVVGTLLLAAVIAPILNQRKEKTASKKDKK
jgi:signal peptidase